VVITHTSRNVPRTPQPAYAHSPPSAAPAKPPMLYTAWNEEMIGRPYTRWTASALAFMATLSTPWLTPKTSSATVSSASDGA
jgi:hypothetical protein